MRLVVGVVTAAICHALLLLGLRWVALAPAPRPASAPNRIEAMEVQVLAPDLTPLGSPASAAAKGSVVASIRRSGRSRSSGRFEHFAGATITPLSTIAAALAVAPTSPSPAPVTSPEPSLLNVPSGVVIGGPVPSAKDTSRGPSSLPDRPSFHAAGTDDRLGIAARYRSHPAPPYPNDSLRRGEEGVVLLSVDVGPDGRSTQISLNRSSGSPSLDSAAVEAVYGWTFEPAQNAGVPVASRVVVPVRFSLVGR
jgi:protein TonB